jgi:hydrogenase maturation factor
MKGQGSLHEGVRAANARFRESQTDPGAVIEHEGGQHVDLEHCGRIVEVRTVENERLALVDVGGTHRPVFLDMIPDAAVGDYVRIRAGFATERVGASRSAV